MRATCFASRPVALVILGVLLCWYLADALLYPAAVHDLDGPRG